MHTPDGNLNSLVESLRQQRRQLAAKSPLAFAEVYLKNNCSEPYSAMHHEMFQQLAEITESRKARVAIAAPRGHAKSTIVSLVYVLWCVLYEKEKLILIASNTTEQAATLLKDVKRQLRDNLLIVSDFPEVCRGKRPKPWRDNKIQLPNGAMIRVYGAGQSPRGIKNDKDRPGLIVCDDLENEEQVESEEQRDKLKTWFSGALLNTGHQYTNVIVVGTVLNQYSLLANLIDPERTSGWEGKVYKAVVRFSESKALWDQWTRIFRTKNAYQGQTGSEAAHEFFEDNKGQMLEGAKVLWPQWESYYDLMVLRQTEGDIFFQREKQNTPLDPQQCIFKLENMQFWDDEYRDIQHLIKSVGEHGVFFGACDPSLGRSARSDYTAIIVLLKDAKTKILYVIAADVIQCTPDEAIQKIIQYAHMYRFFQFAVESNNFQELMVNDLRRRLRRNGYSFKVNALRHNSQKQGRICSLEPYVTQGMVQFSRKHTELISQLTQFPMAKNDDGPDALQMAVELARKRVRIATAGIENIVRMHALYDD